MKRIGLVVRPGVPEALALAESIIEWAKQRELTVSVDERSAKNSTLKDYDTYPPEEFVSKCDFIVTLGGDGTLIGIARHSQSPAPLMVGVNFGTLGFLTEVAPEEVLAVLEQVLDGKASEEERSMVLAEVCRDGKSVFTSQAINDAIVQKGSRDGLLNLDLKVRGEEVMRLRADGMIVSTPTGSTAYSLAAGGSIAYPSLGVVLITPICAHSLTSRPLILPLDFELEIAVPDYRGEVFLSVDGQDSFSLQPSDIVRINCSKNRVRFVTSQSKSYFAILRNKLNWGIANKAD